MQGIKNNNKYQYTCTCTLHYFIVLLRKYSIKYINLIISIIFLNTKIRQMTLHTAVLSHNIHVHVLTSSIRFIFWLAAGGGGPGFTGTEGEAETC